MAHVFFFIHFLLLLFLVPGLDVYIVDVMPCTRISAVMLLKRIFFMFCVYAVLDVNNVSDVVMMVKR